MLKSKSLIALALITAAGLANAQSTTSNVSTSSLGSTYRSLKEGPLDMSLLLGVDATRDAATNEFNGVKHTDIAYLSYRLSPNDSIKLENRMTIEDVENTDSVTTYDRIVLSYKRSNILTEKQHGVGLSANFEKRYLPDAQVRSASNKYGLNRVSVTASNNVGPVSFANSLYFAVTDVRNKAIEKTDRSYWYGVLTQSLSLPADFSFSLTEEIFKNDNKLNSKEYHEAIITAELGKQFTPDIYLGATLVGTPITGNDWGRDTEWTSKLTYGVNMMINAF